MTATVLVVDDLEPNVKLLEAKLLAEYYIVLTANTGSAALETLAQNKIDIVLLDVMMPGMDGITTLGKIKENPHIQQIPVILLTAKAQLSEQKQFAELQIAGVITKPFKATNLVEQMRSLLQWQD